MLKNPPGNLPNFQFFFFPSSGAMFVSFREDIPRMEGFLVGSSAFTSEVMDNGHQCFPRQEPFHENPKTLHHSEALSIFLKIFVKSLRAFPRVIYPQKLTWQWNKLWKHITIWVDVFPIGNGGIFQPVMFVFRDGSRIIWRCNWIKFRGLCIHVLDQLYDEYLMLR